MSVSSVFEFLVNHSYLLTVSEKSYDEDFFSEIRKISSQLQEFLIFYSNKSIVKAETKEKKTNIQEFISTLSSYLNVSERAAESLFVGYLLRDKKIKESDINAMVTRGFSAKSLLKHMKDFYRDERGSLIKLIRYAFCDENEEYRILGMMIFGVTKQDSRLNLFKYILENYIEITKEHNTDKFWQDNTEYTSLNYALEEEIELLETLLLGAYSIRNEDNSELFLMAFKHFKIRNFGNELPLKKYSVKKTVYNSFSDRICVLQSLILIELSGLANLISSGDMDVSSHFLNKSSILHDLIITVRKLGDKSSDSIILLFTSLLMMTFSTAIGGENNQMVASTFAERSIVKLGLLQYLHNLLSSKPYLINKNEGSYLGLTIHCILFDLISLLCFNININSLSSAVGQQIVNLMCTFIKSIMIYSVQQPLNKGFMKLLEDLSTNFPNDMGLLKVANCLMVKSPLDKVENNKEPGSDDSNDSVIEIVLEFIENLSWFCESDCIKNGLVRILNSSSEGNDNSDEMETRQCILLHDYYLYRNENEGNVVLSLESGHQGYIVPGIEDARVVWPLHYSVWHVVEGELDNLLCHTQQLLLDSEMWSKRLIVILHFLSFSIDNNIQLDRIHNIIRKYIFPFILDDARFYQTKTIPALTATLELATKIIAHTNDMDLMHSVVSAQSAFPLATVSSERIVGKESLIGGLIRGNSAVISFDTTAAILAYLDFAVELVRCEKAVKTDYKKHKPIIPTALLHGSVFFISNQILRNLFNIEYNNSSDIIEIAIGCMIFLNEVLSINLKLHSDEQEWRLNRLELLKQLSFDSLPLRTIFCLSTVESNLLLRNSHLSSQMLSLVGTEERYAHVARLALSLLNLMFCYQESSPNNNGDPQSQKQLNNNIVQILEVEYGGSGKGNGNGTGRYATRLLEYLNYPYSVRLTRTAILVVRHLIEQVSDSIISLGSGSIGINSTSASVGNGVGSMDTENAVVRALCNNSADQVIRCQLLELVATCLLTNYGSGIVAAPGAAAFGIRVLSTYNIDSDNSMDWIGSCLTSLSTEAELDDDVCVLVMRAVSKLLLALWLRDCTSVIYTLNNRGLWTILNELFSRVMNYLLNFEKPFDIRLFDLISHIIGVFGMELYANFGDKTKINSIVLDFLASKQLIRLLCLLEKPSLLRSGCHSDDFISSILNFVVWWKTLLSTALANNTISIGSTGGVLEKKILATCSTISKVYNVESGISSSSSAIIDDVKENLCISVLTLTRNRFNSLKPEDAEDLIRAICEVLVNVDSPSAQSPATVAVARRHGDLFSACTIIASTFNLNDLTWDIMSKTTNSYLHFLTFQLHLNSVEEKVLMQVLANSCVLPTAYRECDIDTEFNLLSLFRDYCSSGKHLSVSLIHRLQLSSSVQLVAKLLPEETSDASTIGVVCGGDNSSPLDRLECLTGLVDLMIQSGNSQQQIRFITQYWPILHHHIMTYGISSLATAISNDCLNGSIASTIMQAALDLASRVWLLLHELAPSMALWNLHWDKETIQHLGSILSRCMMVVASAVYAPRSFLFPKDYTFLGRAQQHFAGSGKQVTFEQSSTTANESLTTAWRENKDNIEMERQTTTFTNTTYCQIECSLYRLFSSAVQLYAALSHTTNEEALYRQYPDLQTAQIGPLGLLSISFTDARADDMGPVSFGCLFSFLNATIPLIKDEIAPIECGKDETVSMDTNLMQQIHEICLSIIISHAIVLLGCSSSNSGSVLMRLPSNQRAEMLLNLKSELHSYLASVAKSRRLHVHHQHSMSSTTPTKLTGSGSGGSFRLNSVSEPLHPFLVSVDQFRRCLDNM